MFLCSMNWSLPAQPISIRKVQSRKKPINLCAPREFLKKVCHVWWSYNLVILIQTFRMFSLRESAFRALFTWRTARAKDHRLFYRSYPQINEVGKSCHVVCLPVESLLIFLFPSEFYGQFHQLCFYNNVNKEPRGEGRWPVRPQHIFMFLCVCCWPWITPRRGWSFWARYELWARRPFPRPSLPQKWNVLYITDPCDALSSAGKVEWLKMMVRRVISDSRPMAR